MFESWAVHYSTVWKMNFFFYLFFFFSFKCTQNQGNHHFGVHMADLTEIATVPVVMEVLLEYLEMHGLYTEGIYRKSGAANCMRELKTSLEKGTHGLHKTDICLQLCLFIVIF